MSRYNTGYDNYGGGYDSPPSSVPAPRTPAPRTPAPTPTRTPTPTPAPPPTRTPAPSTPQPNTARTFLPTIEGENPAVLNVEDVDAVRREYPDGKPISGNLPAAYGIAVTNSKCSNCTFYNQGWCGRWQAEVRGPYWCAAYKKMGYRLRPFMMKEESGNYAVYSKGEIVIYEKDLYEVLRDDTFAKLPTNTQYFRLVSGDITSSVVDGGEY